MMTEFTAFSIMSSRPVGYRYRVLDVPGGVELDLSSFHYHRTNRCRLERGWHHRFGCPHERQGVIATARGYLECPAGAGS